MDLKSAIRAAPGYDETWTFEQRLAAMEVTTQGKRKALSPGDVLGIAAEHGLLPLWQDSAANQTDATVFVPESTTMNKRGLAAAALVKVSAGLDMGDPRSGPMLDAMVAVNLLTAAARQAFDDASAVDDVPYWTTLEDLTLNKQRVSSMTLGWIEAAEAS